MGRTLLVKLGAIGDTIMLLPAAQALHRQGHQIEWLCGMQVQPLIGLYPWIKPIVVNEAALLRGGTLVRAQAMLDVWRRLAGERYDLIATLYYDPRYRLLTITARAGRRLHLSNLNRERRVLTTRHHPDEYTRILLNLKDDVRSDSMGPIRPPVMPASPLGRIERIPRVVLVPGGARNLVREDALRRWPVESFVKVASLLLAKGYEILLSGGETDRWASAAFAGLAVNDCIGEHSLRETLGLFDGSDVVVTCDSGPLHLAAITGVRIVAIFGPTSPHTFLPQRAGVVGVWGGEGFACRPCYDGKEFAACSNNLCLQQVTPEMVVREVMRMAEGGGAGRRIVVPSGEVSA